MKMKTLFYALVAMMLVGATVSCQQHDDEPTPEVKEFEAIHMKGNCYGSSFILEFGLFYLEEGSAVVDLKLKVEEVTNGVIPEGVYNLGTTAPCISGVYESLHFRNGVGKALLDITDASLEVGHVDNQYHLVFKATGADGKEYGFDWTGRIESRTSDPFYHPGEAPAQ